MPAGKKKRGRSTEVGGRGADLVVAGSPNESSNRAEGVAIPPTNPSAGKKIRGRGRKKTVLGSGNKPVKTTLSNEAPNNAADVGGGKEAHLVVAAPANEAPNNADEVVKSPTNLPAGKESGNQSADAAPTNETPNIAEEMGRPPTKDDNPNEATALRIEESQSHQANPLHKGPKNDEGGFDLANDNVQAANAETQRDAEHPSKQMQTIPAHHSWSEEKLLDVGDYAYPFTLYQHCLPCNEWMNDDLISTPCSLFPETGPRRKNEVKDNFDWLLLRTKSADIKEAVNAYESSYHFLGGFSSSDRMVSKKISATPQSVDNRCVFYEVHQCVLNHPLCNIEQKVEWLIKPVGNLINRIHSAAKRPPTRGSIQDSRLGHDIFLCAAHVSADEFVSVTDDVELIDFVAKDVSKKIWHCSDLVQSLMLRKAVLAAYLEAKDDDIIPEWYSSLLHADPTKTNATGMAKQIQFLGLVSLFKSKCGNKVNAFRLHCFVLYSFMPEVKETRVVLLLTENCLAPTSANQRIVQILQLVQGDLMKTTSLNLYPDRVSQENLPEAYSALGFTKASTSSTKFHYNYSRSSIIKMPKFTNRTIWSRYGKYVALSYEADNEPLLQMFCRTLSQFLLNPMNYNTSFGTRFTNKFNTRQLSVLATGMPDEVNLCAKYLQALATSLTRVP
jgi:hypothetical protein